MPRCVSPNLCLGAMIIILVLPPVACHIVPSQCLAQPIAMSLAVVSSKGEQAVSIMGQTSRCCMVYMTPHVQTQCVEPFECSHCRPTCSLLTGHPEPATCGVPPWLYQCYRSNDSQIYRKIETTTERLSCLPLDVSPSPDNPQSR